MAGYFILDKKNYLGNGKSVNDWSEIRDQCVIWEDDAALVLNKSAGISVMGERHGTDIIRVAQEAGEKLWWAHRIDKVASGAVLLV